MFAVKALAADAFRRHAEVAQPPVLQAFDLVSRAPCMADVTSGWYAYWMRELGLPPRPDDASWRRAVTLQALYQAGALEVGARSLFLRAGLGDVVACARSFGAEPDEADPAVLDDSGAGQWSAIFWHAEDRVLDPEAVAELAARAARRLAANGAAVFVLPLALFGAGRAAYSRAEVEAVAEAMAAAGAQAAVSFDWGDTPLDLYIDTDLQGLHAAPLIPEQTLSNVPRLKRQVGDVAVTPFALIGIKRG